MIHKDKTMSELRDSPVFIAGHPRSGTSLLRSVLDSHPELVAYPEETSFFRRYLPKAAGKSHWKSRSSLTGT